MYTENSAITPQLNIFHFTLKGLVYRKIPYPGSKVWIDNLLQMIGQGKDVDFEVLVKNIEPFLICPNSQAGKYINKLFLGLLLLYFINQ